MPKPTTLRARSRRRFTRRLRGAQLEQRLAPYTVTQAPAVGACTARS